MTIEIDRKKLKFNNNKKKLCSPQHSNNARTVAVLLLFIFHCKNQDKHIFKQKNLILDLYSKSCRITLVETIGLIRSISTKLFFTRLPRVLSPSKLYFSYPLLKRFLLITYDDDDGWRTLTTTEKTICDVFFTDVLATIILMMRPIL